MKPNRSGPATPRRGEPIPPRHGGSRYRWLVTCQTYTPSGKLLKSWGPAQTATATTCPTAAAPTPITDYVYDDLDRPTQVTENLTAAEGGNRVTQATYFADDRVQTVQRAVGTALAQTYASFTYTPNGLPATMADAKGNLTTTVYDGHDRKTQTRYPDKATPGLSSPTDLEQYACQRKPKFDTPFGRVGNWNRTHQVERPGPHPRLRKPQRQGAVKGGSAIKRPNVLQNRRTVAADDGWPADRSFLRLPRKASGSA